MPPSSRFILIVLCLSGLVACQSASPLPTPTPTVIPPTVTVAPTATATVAPTAIPTNPPTAAPLPTTPGPNPCKLPDANFKGDVGVGMPVYPSRLPSTGTIKATVLFADFADAPAAQTPEAVLALVTPGAADFYRTVSYGHLELQLEPHLTWLRLSQPASHYVVGYLEEQRNYLQEAVTLADPVVDFAASQMVLVMTDPSTTPFVNGPAFTGGPEWGGLEADGVTLYNGTTSGQDLGYWGFKWLNHETGHLLGLADLYSYAGEPYHRFVGGWSMMGQIDSQAPEYFAYERWQLGWVDDAQIVCQQSADATTTLTAVETPDGVKAVLIPTSEHSVVVVESRRALGYDTALTEVGALVYVVDSAIASGQGPITIHPDDGDWRYTAPLAVGETLTVGNVTITVLEATATTDTVRVTVGQ